MVSRCMQCEAPAVVRMKDRALYGRRVRVFCGEHAMVALWANMGTHEGFWRAKREMEFEALQNDH